MTSSDTSSPPVPYWVDLLGCTVRYVSGRHRTRIVEMGDGPPLLLLHGTGGHAENWVRNIPRLAQHFRVIAIDLLWHGLSDTTGYDPRIIPSLTGQVTDVAEALGLQRFHLEGQSLGGWVAMRVALEHRRLVDRLVLTTTMGYTPTPGAIPGYREPDWSANLGSSLATLRDPTFANVKARLERILADPSRLTDEAVLVRQALYRRAGLAAVQQQFVTDYLTGAAIREYVVTDDLARTINVPTLVFWGEENRTPPAYGERLAGQIPDGRFHCAPSTGHWAQFESAEEHDDVVTRFLTSGATLQEAS